jgi:hypothetical protein
MQQIMSPFLWGSNGQAVDPSQYRQQQASMAPIDHPLQGVAQMAQAGVDRYQAQNPQSYFPDAPGAFGNLFGLGQMLIGNRSGGGLY